MARYHAPAPAPTAAIVAETLEAVVREGAQRMLQRALEAEVDAFLGRARYAPGGRATGYRNGHGRPREIGVGTWSVEVRPPRVADLPPRAEPFSSALLPRRRYLSLETQRLFARLYLEGLSSGDFEPAFRELLGEKAPLSGSTILRLRGEWEAEYAAWRGSPYQRPLRVRLGRRHLPGRRARTGVLLPARDRGRPRGRPKGAARDVPRLPREHRLLGGRPARLRDRGLTAPLLAVGDGALGLWAALREVFPATAHQRCWNHRVLNILDKLPKRLWPEARRRLREVWESPSRAACEQRRDERALWLHGRGQDQAAETLYRDWDDFTTFYDFPAEHWLHLRTSNPIESVFAGVRLRTNVAKRARVRENALYLVFKIVERLSTHWRALNGGATVMALVIAGERFVEGVLVKQQARQEEVERAA